MPSMLILDMSGVSFMDSSGIGLILGRQRIMESFGGGVAVKNPSPSVRRIIQVAGLSRLIISGKNTEDKKCSAKIMLSFRSLPCHETKAMRGRL